MTINQKLHIHQLVICSNIFVKRSGRYLLLERSSKKQFAPNFIHPIGGKVDPDENPYLAAIRGVKEESGLDVKNLRLEALILEIRYPATSCNWLVFYFSADYPSGKIKTTNEGKLVWLTPKEILQQNLFPSVRQIIGNILNPKDGTVFATFKYDGEGNIIKSTNKINICKIGGLCIKQSQKNINKLKAKKIHQTK